MQLRQQEIERIAREVADARLPADTLERVSSEDSVDFEGDPAVRVTIVTPPSKIDRVDGEAAMKIGAELQRRLQQAGEDRFAFVRYLTEEDILTLERMNEQDGEDDQT